MNKGKFFKAVSAAVAFLFFINSAVYGAQAGTAKSALRAVSAVQDGQTTGVLKTTLLAGDSIQVEPRKRVVLPPADLSDLTGTGLKTSSSGTAIDDIFTNLVSASPATRKGAVNQLRADFPELAGDIDKYLLSLPLPGKMILNAARILGMRHLYPFKVFAGDTEQIMATGVAGDVVNAVISQLEENIKAGRPYVVMNFAAAPSQDAFLEEFVRLLKYYGRINHGDEYYYLERIIIGVHLDEYIGLPDGHPAKFKEYLKKHLPSRISSGAFYFLDDYKSNERYAQIIKELGGVDIIVCGIGENGHIGFNDPPADFITKGIKEVGLDRACRVQQVRDYPDMYNPKGLKLYDDTGKEIRENMEEALKNVPTHARTMTPAMMLDAKYVFVIVPRKAKAEAVKAFFENDLTPNVPATFLKTHPKMHLYLDKDSSSLVSEELIGKVSGLEDDIALGRPVPAPNIDNGGISAIQLDAFMQVLVDLRAIAMFEVGPGALLTYPKDKPSLAQYCAQEAA